MKVDNLKQKAALIGLYFLWAMIFLSSNPVGKTKLMLLAIGGSIIVAFLLIFTLQVMNSQINKSERVVLGVQLGLAVLMAFWLG